MLASGVQQMLWRDGCQFPGDAVVVTDNPSGYHAAHALKAMGTRVVAVVDHNETPAADPGDLPVRTGQTIHSGSGDAMSRPRLSGRWMSGGFERIDSLSLGCPGRRIYHGPPGCWPRPVADWSTTSRVTCSASSTSPTVPCCGCGERDLRHRRVCP
ncbi:MAG: hypothetical protein Ct9H300mP1_04270 [Planctomycetaceae bacterium]|nr:MAG: hypothetical protein Ct9H300mP1_04270 [Planctomycetaceae bacterium]